MMSLISVLSTQVRLVKEAGDVHLYSSVFAVNVTEDNKKPFEKNTEVEDEEKTGEILALLPHFLAFASLTSAGSFPIESYPLSLFQGGF